MTLQDILDNLLKAKVNLVADVNHKSITVLTILKLLFISNIEIINYYAEIVTVLKIHKCCFK